MKTKQFFVNETILNFKWYLLFLLSILAFSSCKKEDIMEPGKYNPGTAQEDIFLNSIPKKKINPYKYLATFTFDGTDNFDSGERNFPQSFLFNTSQDANNDGSIDAEDNLENLLRYSIGNNLYGTGRSGLPARGPNDQRPAVYFHLAYAGSYTVYEYWFYYADNDWLNDHEHDWEKYFVYLSGRTPQFIKISNHNSFPTYSWGSIPKDYGHPKLGVDGGSHAMKTASEDGVKIRYSGQIIKNNGTLLNGNNQTIPWVIYSNDNNIFNAISFTQTPGIFYYGDPEYSTNSDEHGDIRDAPWMRNEWNNPPMP